jgi:hypothetical protein
MKLIYIIIITIILYISGCSNNVQQNKEISKIEYSLMLLNQQNIIAVIKQNTTNEIMYYFFENNVLQINGNNVTILDYNDKLIFKDNVSNSELRKVNTIIELKLSKFKNN